MGFGVLGVQGFRALGFKILGSRVWDLWGF